MVLSEPVCRRRSGPVDLQMARRRHPQYPRLRARFSRCPRHHARENFRSTKTILAPPTISSPTTSSASRRRFTPPTRKADRSAVLHSRPAWTRRNRSPSASATRSRRETPLPRLRHLFADQRPVAQPRNRVRHPARAVPDRAWRWLLRPQGKQGHPRLSSAADQSARRHLVPARRERTGARHRQGLARSSAAITPSRAR